MKNRNKNNSFIYNIYVFFREIPHSQNDRMKENTEALDKLTFQEKRHKVV